MKKLENAFRKNGFWYNQVSREDDICIYSQHATVNGPVLYYEVFTVQHNQDDSSQA
jgi:hypothetical protein